MPRTVESQTDEMIVWIITDDEGNTVGHDYESTVPVVNAPAITVTSEVQPSLDVVDQAVSNPETATLEERVAALEVIVQFCVKQLTGGA